MHNNKDLQLVCDLIATADDGGEVLTSLQLGTFYLGQELRTSYCMNMPLICSFRFSPTTGEILPVVIVCDYKKKDNLPFLLFF